RIGPAANLDGAGGGGQKAKREENGEGLDETDGHGPRLYALTARRASHLMVKFPRPRARAMVPMSASLASNCDQSSLSAIGAQIASTSSISMVSGVFRAK